MLKLLGFIVAWPIFWLVVSMIINTNRARAGAHINDAFTVFMQGMILPPFAMLGAFSPEATNSGKTVPMLLGGVVGTIAAVSLYSELA